MHHCLHSQLVRPNSTDAALDLAVEFASMRHNESQQWPQRVRRVLYLHEG